MSRYEELVERCNSAITDRNNYSREAALRAILAEVLRTLETVTPEMQGAADNADVLSWSSEEGEGLDSMDLEAAWLAILHASPLMPPKETK